MANYHEEEFYIGYEPKAPAHTATWLRRITIGLLFISAVVAVTLVSVQHQLPVSTFEYGQVKEFTGLIRTEPYPVLLINRPGQSESWSNYLLVGAGKHGADAEVRGFADQSVRLRGSLIYRDGMTMIELLSNSIEALSEQSEIKHQLSKLEDLGEMTLMGEIVDSKCYLGVMNPGRAKVHKDCAVRCISGGAPPLFIAEDSAGHTSQLLLTSANGNAVNKDVLDFVAEPLRITGHVYRDSDQLILRSDPRTYQRIE